MQRFENRVEKNLIIGWAGNSMWSAEKEDFKGLHTLLKPAVKELRDAGYNIELKLCDSNEKMIPHYEMPKYYSQIDVYVCVSKIEGTPNPILECMACGVPFISTNVGIVSEAAGELQSEYILEERTVSCLKEKIIQLYENQDKLKKISDENLVSIKKWDWSTKSQMFLELWKEALQKKEEKAEKRM